MRHVMVDIETLGVKPGSVILSIGACRFDESGIGERFYRPIDVFDSLMHGLKIDDATVGFWRLQSAEARGSLQPALPLGSVLDAFEAFLLGVPETSYPSADTMWAKGPDFDLVLLAAAYTATGRKQPWSYRAARDVRTILALANAPEPATERAIRHHALDDAVYQAAQVINAVRALKVELA